MVELVSEHLLWLGFSADELAAFMPIMTHTGQSQSPGIIQLSALWTLFSGSTTALEEEHFSIGGGKVVMERDHSEPQRNFKLPKYEFKQVEPQLLPEGANTRWRGYSFSFWWFKVEVELQWKMTKVPVFKHELAPHSL